MRLTVVALALHLHLASFHLCTCTCTSFSLTSLALHLQLRLYFTCTALALHLRFTFTFSSHALHLTLHLHLAGTSLAHMHLYFIFTHFTALQLHLQFTAILYHYEPRWPAHPVDVLSSASFCWTSPMITNVTPNNLFFSMQGVQDSASLHIVRVPDYGEFLGDARQLQTRVRTASEMQSGALRLFEDPVHSVQPSCTTQRLWHSSSGMSLKSIASPRQSQRSTSLWS